VSLSSFVLFISRVVRAGAELVRTVCMMRKTAHLNNGQVAVRTVGAQVEYVAFYVHSCCNNHTLKYQI